MAGDVVFGNMAMRVDLGSRLPIEVWFDDIDHPTKGGADHAGWFDAECTSPLTRHSIFYGVLPDRGKVVIPKDPRAVDLREKKPR